MLAAESVVHRGCQGVAVCLKIRADPPALHVEQLFWCGVFVRLAVWRFAPGEVSRAKADELDFAIGSDAHVPGPDIAVDHGLF